MTDPQQGLGSYQAEAKFCIKMLGHRTLPRLICTYLLPWPCVSSRVLLTFKSAVQGVSDMDISKIAFGLLSAGGRAAPCLTLHSSSWCFHSFLTQWNTGSGSKQQELSVAQEEQLCLIHSSRFSIKFGSEGTHFILLLLHWVIHLHLHSFPVDVQRLVVHHSLLKCHWDISYLCLQEAGRANQGSSAHTTGTVASWTLTPSSGNS